nr:putative ribonuclease h protein [Quercus suber]
MKDSVGNWVQGEREIADYIRKGYAELFTSSQCYAFRSAWNLPFWNNCLNEVEAKNLIRPVSSDDITTGLWNSVVFRHENGQRNLKYDVLAKVTKFTYVGLNAKQISTWRQIAICWLFLPLSWSKLNSDGSSIGNPGKAGGGGLIRNDKGEWLKGYARNVGFSTSVTVELWALHDDLRPCIALKLLAVIIELEAKIIVDLV